jgi:5-methyltetrahydropteroyltriglutamate--homocysteine methyltransferase
MANKLLRTSVVGSYPQPDWLIDRERLGSRVPRLRATDIWRIPEPRLEAAQPHLAPSILASLPSKDVLFGVISMADENPETPAEIAERIRLALAVVGPERLIVAPDCGMKYLTRIAAFEKLQAMVAGAAIVREELA